MYFLFSSSLASFARRMAAFFLTTSVLSLTILIRSMMIGWNSWSLSSKAVTKATQLAQALMNVYQSSEPATILFMNRSWTSVTKTSKVFAGNWWSSRHIFLKLGTLQSGCKTLRAFIWRSPAYVLFMNRIDLNTVCLWVTHSAAASGILKILDMRL